MAVPIEQLPWKMGISWFENETVVDEVPAPQGAVLVPEAPVVPEAPAPDAVPDAAPEPAPEVAVEPDSDPPEPEPVLEPLLVVLVPVPQAMPVASEAIVPKERIIDVARRMKTVLSV